MTDLLSTIDKKLDAHNTQKEIAKELGWSTGAAGWQLHGDECSLIVLRAQKV